MTGFATNKLTISGQLDADEFFEFASLYAKRLDLAGDMAQQPGRVEIVIQGKPDVIDMFKVAVWLGPRGSKVDHVEIDRLVETNRRRSGFRWR